MDTTLLKGLDVLEALAASPEPRGVTELAQELGLVKSNIHRVLQTLAHRGYVRKDEPSGRYACTLRVWELGAGIVDRLDVRPAARPAVEALASRTAETVHLSILDGGEVVYIDKVDSPHPVRAYLRIGGRAPAHCVATGKALLAYAPEALLSGMPLRKYTPRTITDRDVLRRELRRVRASGYAVNRGEWRETVGGLAAPILDPQRGAVAAIGISGPVERLGAQRLRELAPLVIKASRETARALGLG